MGKFNDRKTIERSTRDLYNTFPVRMRTCSDTPAHTVRGRRGTVNRGGGGGGGGRGGGGETPAEKVRECEGKDESRGEALRERKRSETRSVSYYHVRTEQTVKMRERFLRRGYLLNMLVGLS